MLFYRMIITLFLAVSLLFVFTVGNFSVSLVGLVGSVFTLAIFYVATHYVAKLRDGPAFKIYKHMVTELRELGTLIAVLVMYVLVAIPVSLAILAINTVAPQAFNVDPGAITLASDCFRFGFGVTLVFGFLYAIGPFPVRVKTLFERLDYLKEIPLFR